MSDIQQTHWEPVKNYAVGVAGMTVGLTDITNFFQAIAAIGGAILVLIQLYKQLRKK